MCAPYFSHYLLNETNFRKEVLEIILDYYFFTNIWITFFKTNSKSCFHKCNLSKIFAILVRFRQESILFHNFSKCSNSSNLGSIDNDVTIVVNAYDVGSSNQKCGKSDINEYNCVE